MGHKHNIFLLLSKKTKITMASSILFLALIGSCAFLVQGAFRDPSFRDPSFRAPSFRAPSFRAPFPCVKPVLGCKPPSVQTITGYDGPRRCPSYSCCVKPLLGCAPSHVEKQIGKDVQGCPIFACQPRLRAPIFRAPIPCVRPVLGCKPPSQQLITGWDGPRGCPTFSCCTGRVPGHDKNGYPINICKNVG